MKLYLHYLKMHFKSAMQYKISFVLTFISQFFVFFTFYFVILSLFEKFGNLKGFNLYEVLLTFSVIHFGYAVAETFARGVDHFDKLIIDGEFDRILIRPRHILLQVLGYKIDYSKISRILQSIIILIIAVVNINTTWNILKVITLILMLISAAVLFFSLLLLAAAYCFYTVQGLEVRNVFTDGGKHMSQYPINIYNKAFFWFFTLIIPYGFINYYPLLFILGKETNFLYSISPIVVVLFFIPCYFIFMRSSKRYLSTGN